MLYSASGIGPILNKFKSEERYDQDTSLDMSRKSRLTSDLDVVHAPYLLLRSDPLYTGARLAVQSQNLLFRITDSMNSDRLPRSRNNLKLAKESYSGDAIEVATEKTVSKNFCQAFANYSYCTYA